MSSTNNQLDKEGQHSRLMVDGDHVDNVTGTRTRTKTFIYLIGVIIIAVLLLLIFLLTSFFSASTSKEIHFVISCSNLSTGIHDIQIDEISSITARCNNEIAGGNWMVILNRFDGSENFTRNWTEFRMGFGNLNGEFFIGLDHLHRITKDHPFELYVTFQYFDGINVAVRYDHFKIGDNKARYTLESLGRFSGTGSDDLMTDYNLNQKFTTYDQDNDEDEKNCAKAYKGAWWFKSCRGPNPLALYSKNERSSELSSMSWNGQTPIRTIQMLIRPKPQQFNHI